MTTRYEASQSGLPDSSIINSSRVTRVPFMPEIRGASLFAFPKESIAPSNRFAAIMIHDGGSVEIKHPETGIVFTIEDLPEQNAAKTSFPSGVTVLTTKKHKLKATELVGFGKVEYKGRTSI